MLRLARKFINLLTSLTAILGGAALFFGLCVIIIDVIGRMMGSPLRGSPDFVSMAFVLMVFGGLPYADKIGGNVSVDLLEPYFSERLNRLFLILANIAGAAIFALIAWQLWESSKISLMLNLSTNILFLPKAPFQYVAVALCAVTSLSMALRVLEFTAGAPLPSPDEIGSEV